MPSGPLSCQSRDHVYPGFLAIVGLTSIHTLEPHLPVQGIDALFYGRVVSTASDQQQGGTALGLLGNRGHRQAIGGRAKRVRRQALLQNRQDALGRSGRPGDDGKVIPDQSRDVGGGRRVGAESLFDGLVEPADAPFSLQQPPPFSLKGTEATLRSGPGSSHTLQRFVDQFIGPEVRACARDPAGSTLVEYGQVSPLGRGLT